MYSQFTNQSPVIIVNVPVVCFIDVHIIFVLHVEFWSLQRQWFTSICVSRFLLRMFFFWLAQSP